LIREQTTQDALAVVSVLLVAGLRSRRRNLETFFFTEPRNLEAIIYHGKVVEKRNFGNENKPHILQTNTLRMHIFSYGNYI
jgi:hypothetical protein